MATFKVRNRRSGTEYTLFEMGDTVQVSWEDQGNGAGSSNYTAAQVQDYLSRQVWIPVEDTPQTISPAALGTFRPVLETRKVGKVRVELVDDGFPLALREIAKVMTWAQTEKGYKDHDWQNLPDAQVQLAAAASRHRTDQIMMHRVGRKPLLECVDPESKLVHKAHEAFGVLAQLELMLRERAE